MYLVSQNACISLKELPVSVCSVIGFVIFGLLLLLVFLYLPQVNVVNIATNLRLF